MLLLIDLAAVLLATGWSWRQQNGNLNTDCIQHVSALALQVLTFQVAIQYQTMYDST